MATHKRTHIFTWLHAFSALLMLGLMLPAGPALAQSGPQPGDGDRRASAKHALAPAGIPGGGLQSGISPSVTATNLIQDPSFELYPPTPWAQYDSTAWGVLCHTADCGYLTGIAEPHTGSGWVWMGGWLSPNISLVQQAVTFPACGLPTNLSFYLLISSDPGYGADDMFRVFIDDIPVFATDATHIDSYSTYQLVSISLSGSFANGAQHTLKFRSDITGHNVSFNLDDVSLTITGTASISGNTGIGGVDLSANGSYMTTSDVSGSYSFSQPYGWSGTVTPTKDGYGFDPENRTYSCLAGNQSGQNYTAVVSNAIVYIGGNKVNEYYVPPSGRVVPSYPGTFNGPVEVKERGSSGIQLLTSQRVVYGSSFSETLGFPNGQLTTDYWFPWYDFTGMSTWIVVGNTSSTTAANVEVWIAGVKVDNTTIPANGRWTPAYPGTFNGPVEVKSTNGVNILVSQRALYGSSFTETLGFPANQLTTDYWFPWYDFTGMSTWIIVGNTSSSQAADVEIWMAGSKVDSYTIPANGRWTPAYPGKFDGPVEVKSTNGVKIFTSQRALYKTSFTETLGFPAGQLTTDYLFPWYDFTGMSTWIIVGNTSGSLSADVEVWVAGSKVDSKTIDPNGQWTPAYVGTSNGPVEVKSTNGVNIFVSQRALYGSSFKETLGFPANQLTNDYWYSWYDFTGMSTWLVIARP